MTQLTKRVDAGALVGEARRPFISKLTSPAAAVFLLVILLTAPVVHHWGEQQASRYALTAALWDQQTVVIDDYNFMLGRDRVVVDGTTYSDKAPGQPFLAVPFYGIYRLLGGDSPIESYDADADLGMWWVTLWSSAVPGAILALLMYRWAREFEERTALRSTITIALGTLLLVYSTILFGHVLASLFAFGMFLLVRTPKASAGRLLLAGALGGLAVLTEYPLVVVVFIVAVAAVVRHRARGALVPLAGLPAAVLLGVYQYRLFGNAFTYTYRWSAFSGPREDPGRFLGFFADPTLERIAHVLFSPRGLIIATPIVLIAVFGLHPMWRKGWRLDVVVSTLSILAMLAIPALWGNSYAGGAGPRYFTPALPFLVGPLALAWKRWRVLAIVSGAVSIVTMISATLTEPQMATDFEAGLGYWLILASRGDIEPTVYGFVLGGWGWLLYAVTILMASLLVIRAWSVVTREAATTVDDRDTRVTSP